MYDPNTPNMQIWYDDTDIAEWSRTVLTHIYSLPPEQLFCMWK